jgi:hypothetical protein
LPLIPHPSFYGAISNLAFKSNSFRKRHHPVNGSTASPNWANRNNREDSDRKYTVRKMGKKYDTFTHFF